MLAPPLLAWGTYARDCAEVERFTRACIGCDDPSIPSVALVDALVRRTNTSTVPHPSRCGTTRVRLAAPPLLRPSLAGLPGEQPHFPKTQALFRLLLDLAPSSAYFLKVDTDTFLNLRRLSLDLAAHLHSVPHSRRAALVAAHHRQEQRARNATLAPVGLARSPRSPRSRPSSLTNATISSLISSLPNGSAPMPTAPAATALVALPPQPAARAPNASRGDSRPAAYDLIGKPMRLFSFRGDRFVYMQGGAYVLSRRAASAVARCSREGWEACPNRLISNAPFAAKMRRECLTRGSTTDMAEDMYAGLCIHLAGGMHAAWARERHGAEFGFV